MSSVLLLLPLVVAAVTPAKFQRGRPKLLPNNTIVTDTGVPLRGPAWSKCFLHGGNRNNISEADVAALMAFDRTPFNALHVYHDAPGCKTGGLELAELDAIVGWAADHGVYVVIVAAGDSWLDQWSLWWPVLAPRYANQSHVLYEMINEPSVFNTHDPVAWNASASQMAVAFAAIKRTAPEIPVLLPTIGALNPNQYEEILYGSRSRYPSGPSRDPFKGGITALPPRDGVAVSPATAVLSFHTYDGDEFPRVGQALDVVQGLGWAAIDTEVPTNQTGSCNLACCCNVNPKWTVRGRCAANVTKTAAYEKRGLSWLSFVSVLNVSGSLAAPLVEAGVSWHDPYTERMRGSRHP